MSSSPGNMYRGSGPQRLLDLVMKQFDLNRARNLLHPDAEELLEVDPLFLSSLEQMSTTQNPVALDTTLRELSRRAADLFVERLYSLNQYFQIGERIKKEITGIYYDSARKILCSSDIISTIRRFHYPKLKRLVVSICPRRLADSLREHPELNPVSCCEYTAGLQLELLRLDTRRLRQPLLDVGCGPRANLVRFFRSAGVDAYGFDRNAPGTDSFVSTADWFEYDYGTGCWGTVVSNLSFVSHLSYTRRFDPSGVDRYLDAGRRILSSLAPGGAFVFAPADELLEETAAREGYRVESWHIPGGFRAAGIVREVMEEGP